MSAQHWTEVIEHERRVAAAHAEMLRKQQQAQAIAAVENARSLQERKARYDAIPWWRKIPKETRKLVMLGYFLYVVPVATMILVDVFFESMFIDTKLDWVGVFFPVLNLFAYIGVPPAMRTLMLTLSTGLVVVGLIGAAMTRPVDFEAMELNRRP